MSRIEQTFARLRADRRTGLVTYVTAGDPNLAATAEILRTLDSLLLTSRHQVSTPVNWQDGEDVIISGSVSDEAAKQKYPGGWKSPKPYIRIVPQPRD